jgi:hypothetical protein
MRSYRIVVRGEFGDLLSSAFSELHAEPVEGETVLTANVGKSVDLYSILEHLRDFGIEFVSVREVPYSESDEDLLDGPWGNRRTRPYRVVVQGEVAARVAEALGDASIAKVGGLSVITFRVRDESHLWGIMDRLRDLEVEFLSADLAAEGILLSETPSRGAIDRMESPR